MPGQKTCAELASEAAAGSRPRKDYVELARKLDAEVLDGAFMRDRATPIARLVAGGTRLPAGQIMEALVQGRRYRHVFAWGDRLGLPLALLFKLTRSDTDLVLFSIWASRPKKALFFRPLRVDSHIRAIISSASMQLRNLETRLGVPRAKLHSVLVGVDERFWRPYDRAPDNVICAVGWEARDYETLFEAVDGLDIEVHIALGSVVWTASAITPLAVRRAGGTLHRRLPPNVKLRYQLSPLELRELYARARLIVTPLADVDFDAGSTSISEAMAMGKAVIVARSRGQIDMLRHGDQGLYVPPSDGRALRQAIEYLATHPAEAARMGRAGRAFVEQHCTLDRFVSRLALIVCAEAPGPKGTTSSGRTDPEIARA